MKKLLNWLKLPGARWGLGLGVLGTFAFVIVYSVALDFTNRLDFCTSCHSMKFPYEEYKKSFHYQNTVGVRATCADCHVPHDYPAVLVAKVFAVKDVIGEILGTVNTPEKFEENRLKMAKRVWAKMEARESKECRNCHDLANMMTEEQGRRAQRKHQEAVNEGQHCIQCHKGVVHELPKGYEG